MSNVYTTCLSLEQTLFTTSQVLGSPFPTENLQALIVDINVVSLRGTTPSASLFVERLGADNNWYPMYSPTALTAAGFASTVIGYQQQTPALLTKQARLRLAIGGTAVATTVTTGANSSTQTLGSTASLAVGDSLHFATANVNRTIVSITNGTTVVLNTAVNSTTSEAVTVNNTPAVSLSASIQGKQ